MNRRSTMMCLFAFVFGWNTSRAEAKHKPKKKAIQKVLAKFEKDYPGLLKHLFGEFGD